LKERRVLVITHCHFGEELVKSVEMIMGKQDYVTAMGLLPGCSVDDLRESAFEVLAKNDADGADTIVCCDLFGGSPSNVALSCLGKSDCKVMLGVNMPMLVQLAQDIHDTKDLDELVNTAAQAARDGVVVKDRAILLGK
jgi:mannose/fructose/sorbose-specific phosphotransferase system IIA component